MTSAVTPVFETAYEMFSRSKARGTDATAGMPFQPGLSPLHERALFLVGAPRSGTTWLQQLLAMHPHIATAGEMHVFCEGVAPLFANHAGTDQYSGLSGWVTRPELVTMVRSLVDGIMLRLRDTTRPDATHVLDKTPNHVPYAALAAEVYPDATFVQIIRDGRDAAASAQQMFGHSVDYQAFGRNAERWRDAVLDCRAHLGHLNYVEVRYEDLLADTPAGLARIYEAAGLPYDADFLRRCTEFASVPINVRPSKATVSARKYDDLPPDVEREILVAAGTLLVDLGYVDGEHVRRVLAHRTARRTVQEGRQAAVQGAARVTGAVRSRLGRAARATSDRARVRSTARSLVEALTSGDEANVAQRLAADVVVTDGDVRIRGAAAAAGHLTGRVRGLREVSVTADETTAGVQWSDGAGNSQLHRLEVDDAGSVASVAVSASG